MTDHGNVGNKNAEKEIHADSHLHVRIESGRKAGYVKAAHEAGLKLSEWIIKELDKACKGYNANKK